MSTNERKEWRRSFTETILELAKGRVDVLEAASWAMEAQHIQGYRDPQEVAREQFKKVDAKNAASHVTTSESASALIDTLPSSPEFLLTRPDQNRLDTGAP